MPLAFVSPDTKVTGAHSDDDTTTPLIGSAPSFCSWYVNVTDNGARPLAGDADSVKVVCGVFTVTVTFACSSGAGWPSAASVPVPNALSVNVPAVVNTCV